MRDGENALEAAEENVYPIKTSSSRRIYAGTTKGTSVNQLKDNRTEIEARGITLRIIPGTGGIAIETSYYLNRSDEYKTALFVIPDDKDLGEELSKIITIQSMHL